jgi:WD40 repeat protein/energy-coupling factor transporter ATP-binding protein EcfA2
MGRPERPIDPTAGPLQQLAYDLRQLRQADGNPSYKKLSGRVPYSVTALSEAAGGDIFPTLDVTLAYVTACGGDRAEWEARWRAAEQQLAANGQRATADQASEATEAQNAPYLGLTAFQSDDADRFFGRKGVVDDLLERLKKKSFLALFGSSGSGKSSVLRAGLIPAVLEGRVTGSQDWQTILLTPGEHPRRELATHLAELGSIPAGSIWAELGADPTRAALTIRQVLTKEPQVPRLFVVDQFEEVFTLCQDMRERVRFIDALLALRAEPANRATVVLGIRADFYPRCAEHADLLAALQDAQVLLGPMQPGDLRAAITQPAAKDGLTVEPELVATILADVVERPGALPLLSHALLQTWHRRKGSRLTLAGYQGAGGVEGAITQTAEGVYSAFNESQQRIARRVFLRLTALGEGTEDTRRRVNRTELDVDGELSDTAMVVDRLAAQRLITLGKGSLDVAHEAPISVEVAHEALIQAWPRLRQWLAEDRAGLRIHRQLTEAAQAWEALKRDSGALYRGTRLASAREWADRDERHRSDLNPSERSFLEASVALEAAEQTSAARRTRRLLQLVAALVILLVLTATLGGVVYFGRQASRSRQLAAQAAALTRSQPAASALLSAEAFRFGDTAEAHGALLSTSGRLPHHAVLNGDPSYINGVAVSPDGQVIASAGGADNAIILWDAVRHTRLATLAGHTKPVEEVAFSPLGHLLASAGGRDQTLRLWNVADPRHPSALATLPGHRGRVKAVAFNPDGRLLASADADNKVILWDVASRAPVVTFAGHSADVNAVVFSADGRTLFSASDDRTIQLWDVERRSALPTTTLVGPEDAIKGLALSPDGHTLASASRDRKIRLWDMTHPSSLHTTLVGHTEEVNAVAFSPDSHTLASASNDHDVMVWEVPTGKRLATLTGHTNWVSSVAFSPDGQTLVSGSGDHSMIVWSPVLPPFTGHTDAINEVALSPDGRILASAGSDKNVILWDMPSRSRRETLDGHTDAVTAVAFSPDGRTLASASTDKTIILWDVASGSHRPPLVGHTDKLNRVAFSPDGSQLASASADGTIILWDTASGARLNTVPSDEGQAITDVMFSPDGRRLVWTGLNRQVVVWDRASRKPTHVRIRSASALRAVLTRDGGLLATPTIDYGIILWDMTTLQSVGTKQGHTDPVTAVAFSRDGRMLASASYDGVIVLWDVAEPRPIATFTGHTSRVNSLAFTPDGGYLISASDDKTIVAWNTDTRQTVTDICTVVARDLTPEEWSIFAPGIPYHHTCS